MSNCNPARFDNWYCAEDVLISKGLSSYPLFREGKRRTAEIARSSSRHPFGPIVIVALFFLVDGGEGFSAHIRCRLVLKGLLWLGLLFRGFFRGTGVDAGVAALWGAWMGFFLGI